ncbi:hypothetical protein LSUCC0031_05500 [Rhodobacterales bacterium LSUCC0031]|nr:hypothetical protein [Rhodobacterales bacterium LSUCC0031]
MQRFLCEFGQGAEEVEGQDKGFLSVGQTAAVEFRVAEVVELHPKPFAKAVDVSNFRRMDDEEDVEELGGDLHSVHLRFIQKNEQPALRLFGVDLFQLHLCQRREAARLAGKGEKDVGADGVMEAFLRDGGWPAEARSGIAVSRHCPQ